MPQTTFQKLCFMFLTVLITVTSFTIYNTALHIGSLSNAVFLLAVKEIPVEFCIAFVLEAAFFYKLAEHLAFRLVDPKTDRPIVVILAITSMTISLMCPSMSFAATILYDGINAEFIANWLEKILFNFPFAFFTQLFFIGPLVRFLFRTIFRNQGKTAAA